MTDNYSERAARGQALNLAVNEAIAEGRARDNVYVLKRFVHYYETSLLIQSIDIEELKKELI